MPLIPYKDGIGQEKGLVRCPPRNPRFPPPPGARSPFTGTNARGIVQLALSGPERISGSAIISKVPVTFTRVMFVQEISATTRQLAVDFREESIQLRIIARDPPSRPGSSSGRSTDRGSSSW